MILINTVRRRHGEDANLRIPEFINRLDRLNFEAIHYEIPNNVLRFRIIDEALLTNFDLMMMEFINDNTVVPIRFVSRTREFIDSHFLGTVDIDDLLGGSDHSLRMNLLHILVERFRTPNYLRVRRVFERPHRLAIESERDYLREVLQDPTIRYTGERERRNNQTVFTFRSNREYRIEHLFSQNEDRVISEVFIIQDGNRLTLEDFLQPVQ